MAGAAVPAAAEAHPVHQYAIDVVDGRVVAGKPVLWACQRHLDDLERGEKRAGLWFDEAAADRIIRFFRLLRFFEGARVGEAFELEPWQKFVVGSIFGWMNDTGLRRFGDAWVEVGRGNGKSPLAAGIGLYCTGFEGEAAGQVFTLATKREQARIIHGTALKLLEHAPALRGKLTSLKDNIIHPASGSTFRPLGRDSHTEDGWNPYVGLADEVHAWPNGGLWDVMENGMVKRDQPLLIGITTAGTNLQGFGRHQHDYYLRLIDPQSRARVDRAFVYAAMLEQKVGCRSCKGEGCDTCEGRGYFGDDPYDEKVWPKVNPNMGVSVMLDGPKGFRALAAKAKLDRRVEAEFFVKNLNLWGQRAEKAIALAEWDACGAACPMPTDDELKRRPCYIGLDLSSTKDLTALARFWPASKRHPQAVLKLTQWVPALRVEEKLRTTRVDYLPWIEAGWIIAQEGKRRIDHEEIRVTARDLGRRFNARKIAADPKYGEWILPALEADGFEVEWVVQSFSNLCAPWLELERLIETPALAHGGDPVLRWQAGNVVLRRGGEGDVMPSKSRSDEKIDGIMAALNAIRAWMLDPTTEAAPPPPITHHRLPPTRGGGSRSIYNVFR